MLKKRRGKKKRVTEIIKKKKNYRYKVDNKYQKAKIKNLEQSLEFKKYNVKENKEKKRKEKKNKVKKIIKNIYMKFALKKNRVFFFFAK